MSRMTSSGRERALCRAEDARDAEDARRWRRGRLRTARAEEGVSDDERGGNERHAEGHTLTRAPASNVDEGVEAFGIEPSLLYDSLSIDRQYIYSNFLSGRLDSSRTALRSLPSLESVDP